jgi:hypothetical protein
METPYPAPIWILSPAASFQGVKMRAPACRNRGQIEPLLHRFDRHKCARPRAVFRVRSKLGLPSIRSCSLTHIAEFLIAVTCASQSPGLGWFLVSMHRSEGNLVGFHSAHTTFTYIESCMELASSCIPFTSSLHAACMHASCHNHDVLHVRSYLPFHYHP